jgi:predicted small metal-binding protein
MKILHCSDVGFECQAVVKANTEEEVLKIAAEHASSVHGVNVTPDMAEEIKHKIKEEN